ncbi:CU044_5270 family protein [Streptomyces palmae]|uniref:CU044_5270 family protein n=1 Tax=Streptomyces palmae TaxID=1701085 RepID=A0A4Z0H9R6_9ACTN|nr:CU044_5270 family protein [Streptomyces palmae]TGB08952.1 hypothetical protein E4099_14520 [Streptomyces palmae]
MTERQELLDFPGAEALQAAGHVEPPSAQALARAMAAVRAAAQDEAGSAAVTPFRRRRIRVLSGRRITATLLSAAAVAAGVAVYTGTGAGSTGAGATSAPHRTTTGVTAATFLNDTAEVAATTPISYGPYWKMRLKASDSKGTSRTFTEYISRSGHHSVVANGRTHHKPLAGTWRLGPKQLGWNDLDRLPTDPVALLSLMNSSKEYAGQSAFVQAGSILGSSPASPPLRAALYKALARMQGVKLVGTVKDGTGRSGTELVFNGVASQDRMIVDPRTGVLLETVSVQTKESLHPVNRLTYLSVGPATKIG